MQKAIRTPPEFVKRGISQVVIVKTHLVARSKQTEAQVAGSIPVAAAATGGRGGGDTNTIVRRALGGR